MSTVRGNTGVLENRCSGTVGPSRFSSCDAPAARGRVRHHSRARACSSSKEARLSYVGHARLSCSRLQGGPRSGHRNRKLACYADQEVLSEDEAWKKRSQEAKENGNNTSGEWHWTLNWDQVLPSVIVGSCPRSPSDVDRLVDEAGIEAIVCLQSDDCFQALGIDWEAIRQKALERQVVMSRVAVRDFDKNDQASMLPECVRVLAGHLRAGRRVYVHCTAGINRASLTVVGYLTFVENKSLNDALDTVKSARPQAHPYVESWKECCSRMLEGRTEELIGRSRDIYKKRCENGDAGDSKSDWQKAEKQLIYDHFARRLETDACTLDSIQHIHELRSSQEAEERFRLVHSRLDHAREAAVARAEAAEQMAAQLQQQIRRLELELESLQQSVAGRPVQEKFQEAPRQEGDVSALQAFIGDDDSNVDEPVAVDPLRALCADLPNLEECVVFLESASGRNDTAPKSDSACLKQETVSQGQQNGNIQKEGIE